jgi:hypothetical protein
MKTANSIKGAKPNAWGMHDRYGFIGRDQGTPVRCPRCNNLFSQDFFDEGRCPNCKLNIARKSVQRDMYVEAQQVKVHGGWDHAKLEALAKLRGSGFVTKDGQARDVNSVARNLTAMKTIGERQADARSRLISELRKMSSVSNILRSKVR